MTWEIWKCFAAMTLLLACTYGMYVATELVEAGDPRHIYLAIPCLMLGAVSIVETLRSLFRMVKEDKLFTPLVLAIIAATSATCSADCRHLYHRQAIVAHHAYVQPAVVLYSVGDATLIEAQVEKVLAKRQQQTAPQVQQSTLSLKCARCHSGAEPKAGIDFTRGIDAETFRRSIELLGTGKDTPAAMKGVLAGLSPTDKGSLTEELLTLSARPAAAKREPQQVPPEPGRLD